MVVTGVVGRAVRREHAEEVVGAGGRAEEEQQPGRLQVAELGRGCALGGHPGGDAGPAVAAAQRLQSRGARPSTTSPWRSGGRGPSPDPNISGRAGVWLERSKVRRLLTRGVPDAGLALVELDPSMIPEGICEVAIKGGDTLGRADDIGIVEEGKHALAWLQCGSNGAKGSVLGDCVECRHQGVALLPALGLQDLVFRADIVGPDIAALGAVELASERQERG